MSAAANRAYRDYRKHLRDAPPPPPFTVTGHLSDPGPCWVYDLRKRRRGTGYDSRVEAVAACALLNAEAAARVEEAA
jgi:hypothetical protein